MAREKGTELVLQDSEFEVDSDGYFSGGVQCQMTNIPVDGLLVQCYLEFSKDKAIALISEVSEGFLTQDDDTIYIAASGSLDGNALPDTFTLNYRLFTLWDSVQADPSLPSSFGEQNISVPPKGLLGGSKWKCAGNNEVLSILVHNDNGDFQITSNVQVGKVAGTDIGLVVEHGADDSTNQFVIFRSPSVSIKNQYGSGSEKLKSHYRFFKPQKWNTLDKLNPITVTRS